MSKRKDHSSGAPILELLAARALRKRGWSVKLPRPVRRPGLVTRAASSALGAALGWVLPGALSNTRIDPSAWIDLSNLLSKTRQSTDRGPDIIDTVFERGPSNAPPQPVPFIGFACSICNRMCGGVTISEALHLGWKYHGHSWLCSECAAARDHAPGQSRPDIIDTHFEHGPRVRPKAGFGEEFAQPPCGGAPDVGPPVPFIGFVCSVCNSFRANAGQTMCGGVTMAEAMHLGWKYVGHSSWLCPVCAAAAEPPKPAASDPVAASAPPAP